jgi:hypothetical protein
MLSVEQDLAADDSGSSPRAFFEYFEAIVSGSRIKGLKDPSVEDQQLSPPALAGCGDGSHRGLAVARRGDPTNCCTVGLASRASLPATTAASQGHECHGS